jgi:hypothetical protein
MLSVLLHAPRGPFYSPKAARIRWRSTWKAILAFCRVVHQTVQCAISFLFWRSRPLDLRICWHTRTQSGAHQIVWCDHPTIGWATCLPLIAQATVGHWHRWLTGQSGAPPNSPVNFSCGAFGFSWEWRVRRRRLRHWRWWLTGQSGAPLDSPMIYSHIVAPIPESGQFAAGPAWAPGLSGAPPDSLVCHRLVLVWLT